MRHGAGRAGSPELSRLTAENRRPIVEDPILIWTPTIVTRQVCIYAALDVLISVVEMLAKNIECCIVGE